MTLNHGEELKKNFRPSPELRITLPSYKPSPPPTYNSESVGYTLPKPAKTV